MGVISIVVPYTDRWYFTEILQGATQHVRSAGHTERVHVIPPSRTSSTGAADAIEHDFAEADSLGAVVAGFKYQPDQAERAIAWRRPLVVIGGSTIGFPVVMIDEAGATRLAVMHLLHQGHTRIVHFAGDLTDQMDFSVHGRRAKEYRAIMESAGLEPVLIENEFDPDAAYQSAKALLAGPTRPTAIFAVSDEIAFAVLAAARDAGLRPGPDLAVVGIDDHPRAEAEGLTTVRQLPAEMGATAVEMILGGLEHGPDPKQSRLAPIALVTRTSTGGPRRPLDHS